MQLPIDLDCLAITPLDSGVFGKLSEHITMDGHFNKAISRSRQFGQHIGLIMRPNRRRQRERENSNALESESCFAEHLARSTEDFPLSRVSLRPKRPTFTLHGGPSTDREQKDLERMQDRRTLHGL